MKLTNKHFPVKTLLALSLASLLAACGGSDSAAPEKKDDAAVTIDTAGRLAIAEKDSKRVFLRDLDNHVTEATYQLDNAGASLYPSPNGRHVVATQRAQDLVQFIDGGIWQEDHVNHLHDYKQASKLLSWTLAGSRPTHYDVQVGKQAVIFFDGDSTATPVKNASVRVITDTSIASGAIAAGFDLNFSIHGFAEPIDNKILSVSRAVDAIDTLPTHVQLYQRNGNTYTSDRQLATRCDGMHGSFTAGKYTAVGCLDGVMLIEHTGPNTVSDKKIATPIRIGTLLGHVKVPEQFIAIGSEGAAPAPVTTRFYAITGNNATATAITINGWEPGTVQRASGFDRTGNRFYIVDSKGNLSILQRQGTTWSNTTRIAGLIPSMPTAAPWPAISANGAKDEIYFTDPVARQLVHFNTATASVSVRRDLSFVPATALWVGISR
jgi:hypothetical protein